MNLFPFLVAPKLDHKSAFKLKSSPLECDLKSSLTSITSCIIILEGVESAYLRVDSLGKRKEVGRRGGERTYEASFCETSSNSIRYQGTDATML